VGENGHGMSKAGVNRIRDGCESSEKEEEEEGRDGADDVGSVYEDRLGVPRERS
jgi:hypothetical protein